MTKIPFLLTLFVTALVCLLPAAPVQAAGIARTFLSAAGSDSNNCANVLTPCRHLATAFAATAADGEIYVLDPANYGSLTITHGISIEGHGWASIAPVSGSPAITINASPGDKINIIGVVLDGTALANTNGIVFNSGGSLTVADSVVRNFAGDSTTGNGILMQPTSGTVSFVITNTIVSNNHFAGIMYNPPNGSTATANGVIDHVAATSNEFGLWILTANGGGATAVAISNSVASNNGTVGIFFQNGSSALQGSIDNSSISGNGNFGIDAETASDLEIGRSVITYNGTGIQNNTSPNRIFSYLDNRINSNATNIGGSNGTTLMSHALQ
jgi:hypothetical protein